MSVSVYMYDCVKVVNAASVEGGRHTLVLGDSDSGLSGTNPLTPNLTLTPTLTLPLALTITPDLNHTLTLTPTLTLTLALALTLTHYTLVLGDSDSGLSGIVSGTCTY